jgi:cobalt/nickel transport system permease protein
MHIPDGLLAPRVLLPLGGITAIAVVLSAAHARREMEERPGVLALTGVLGAFILAAQMVNFPVLPGVSGHLLGGVLAGALLGPHLATLAMVAVFAFQAFVQSDGGVLALGANTFNMGIIATFLGTGLLRALRATLGGGASATLAAAFAASLISVEVGALACALEVAVSDPRFANRTFLGLMLGHHAVIGAIEGAITVGILAYVGRLRPDLLDRAQRAADTTETRRETVRLSLQMLLAAAIIGVVLASLASELTDGFDAARERGAKDATPDRHGALPAAPTSGASATRSLPTGTATAPPPPANGVDQP